MMDHFPNIEKRIAGPRVFQRAQELEKKEDQSYNPRVVERTLISQETELA
jgi:hypothetical protein